MNARIITIILLLYSSSVALSQQCMTRSEAFSKQSTCVCNNQTDYPGGCQATPFEDQACKIMSYYTCGTNGTKTCQIAFTETVDSCGPNPNRPTAMNESPFQRSLGRLVSDRLWVADLNSAFSGSETQCDKKARAFQLWLNREIKLQASSAKGPVG